MLELVQIFSKIGLKFHRRRAGPTMGCHLGFFFQLVLAKSGNFLLLIGCFN